MEILWGPIEKNFRELGGTGWNILWLKTTDAVTADLLDGLVPVIDPQPSNSGWVRSPYGGWLLSLEENTTWRDWLPMLADSLARGGVSGTISAAKRSRPPRRLTGDNRRISVVDFSYATVDRRAPGVWGVTPDRAARIIAHGVEWLAQASHTMRTTAGGGLALDLPPEPGGQLIQEVLTRDTMGAITVMEQSTSLNRRATFHGHGECALEVSGPGGVDCAGALDRLRDGLVSAPLEGLQQAIIHPAPTFTWVVDAPVRVGDLWNSMANRERYVVAPGWAQILTDKHLDAAHNLDQWTVTPLDDTHYLVEAASREGWCDYIGPHTFRSIQPDVLAQAQADFGDMIFPPAKSLRANRHGALDLHN